MLPHLSLNTLRTEVSHLTSELTHLAPNTPEYQVVRQKLQRNQAAIQAVTQSLRDLGNGLTR